MDSFSSTIQHTRSSPGSDASVELNPSLCYTLSTVASEATEKFSRKLDFVTIQKTITSILNNGQNLSAAGFADVLISYSSPH